MAQQSVHADTHIGRALEAAIHIGLLIALTAACLLILRPFIPLIAWGIIIAVAAYPGFCKVQRFVGGRKKLAAVICTLLFFTLLIVPVVLLSGSLVDGIQTLVSRIRGGTLIIPPPPERIGEWPLIGSQLKHAWGLASANLSAALQAFAPQIKAIIPDLLLASAGIGLTVLQWIASILVAGVLLANADNASNFTGRLASRLFGKRGSEFEQLATATVRSVTTGIIGVALIQSFFAAVGFLVVGLPGAGLWAVIFLLAAVLQLGGLVLIPAVIYMFTIATTTKAIVFLVWCVIVGVMDNILKPLLLGRGVAVPMAVVFLGAIGGFVAMGTVGLFVGAIVLSVGYKLVVAWLEPGAQPNPELIEKGVHTRVGA